MAMSNQEEALIRINQQLEKGLRLTDQINKNRPRRISTKLESTLDQELKLKRLVSNEE